MHPDAADYWLQAERNLARARNDLAHAFYDGAVANAQQAAELALKALVVDTGTAPPYTHDLDELARVLAAHGRHAPADVRTHAHAIPSGTWTRARYPDPAVHFVPARDISEAEARGILDHAEAVWAWVHGQLLPPAPPPAARPSTTT
jgi:HEPN domain-containing protein